MNAPIRLLSPVRLRHAEFFGVVLFILFAFAVTASAQQSVTKTPVARLIGAMRSVPADVLLARVERPSVRASNVNTRSVSSPAMLGATSDEERLFGLINAERARYNLIALAWDADLCRAARGHSGDMARVGKLNHAGSDGSDASMRARNHGSGGWRAVGENIAFNQGFEDPVAFALERWMKSSKHRENILNPMWTRAALGIARASDGSVYFTQVFVAER